MEQSTSKNNGSLSREPHQKLGGIAAVEPLQTKLDDLYVSWAGRSTRAGHRQTCQFLTGAEAPKHTPWHNSTWHKSGAVCSGDRNGEAGHTYGSYLGTIASVADAERQALTLATYLRCP